MQEAQLVEDAYTFPPITILQKKLVSYKNKDMKMFYSGNLKQDMWFI